MAEELDVQTNFRSQEWEQARETLDGIFHRIFDILKSNPTLHALVDEREGEPQHKAGDFGVDYRDGNVKLKMSDGKNLLEIGLSALGGTITAAQHGDLPGGTLHDLAVPSVSPGFISGADKDKLDGLSNAVPSNAIPLSAFVGTGGAGSATTYARGDHVHAVVGSATTPLDVVASGATAGNTAAVARANHSHNHGNLAGGALHAVAIAGGAAGFLSGVDKAILDRFDGYFTNATGSPPAISTGHFGIWYDTSGNLWLIAAGGGGAKKVAINVTP